MSSISRHYVLAAGGTGGHLTPAFALAHALERRGHHVALITDERGAAIPGKPDFLTAHVLPAGRFGKNPLGWPKGIAAMIEGRGKAKRIYNSFEPSAVIGFGGYPAMPALLAANSMKIPTIIHEQNAVLGRVNRLFAGRVNAIATAYPEVDRLNEKHAIKTHLVGNPVVPAVLSLRDEPFPPFTEDGLLKILITGGSQGASVLSKIVPEGLSMLPPPLCNRLQITQQCRPEDIDGVRALYAKYGIPAELGTYFEDMPSRLADAHLFIGRAGASTIAELTAVGRPAILIPLPIATDDHQSANTREMTQAGGGRMIRQPMETVDLADDFTDKSIALRKRQDDILHKMSKDVARQIQALAQQPETLATAAHASWNCGRPKAAEDLADLVEGFGGAPIQDVIRVAGEASTARASTKKAATGGALNRPRNADLNKDAAQ